MKFKTPRSEHPLNRKTLLDQNRNSLNFPENSKHLIEEGGQPGSGHVDDLTTLSSLTEESVLQSIEERFKAGIYYTWAGSPLVAVNPFQDVDELYDEEMEENYKIESTVKIRELPPHIFAIGQKAYCELKRGFETSNQSIIVSGESGAGKTWTTRTLMQFIADMAGESGCDRVSCIEQRILDSNPVLEAFGNAATLRNENSSRFGKYIQLQFDSASHIVGAKIKTYLLEKTRVVHQSSGEKNFHIFYQISSMSDCQKLNKRKRRSSRWGGEDRQAFIETCEAMKNIGIQEQLQADIFKVLAGIEKICKVSFEESHDGHCRIQNRNTAQGVCSLLELDEERFSKSMNTRRIITGSTKEEFIKPCCPEECVSRRDSLAKLIYARLFDWIVDFINTSIKAPSHSKHSFIGLLDVYGFESFDHNSLEQLCINYANEKLQQHFVSHFLKIQQEEYQKEGIKWIFQEFSDNRQCLNVIEGRVSVFSLMNEECRLNRVIDDESFCDRLGSALDHNKHFSRLRLKSQKPEFLIQHFAAKVCYQTRDLIEKNKDQTAPEVMELLQSSSNLFLRQLFENNKEQPCESTKRPRPSNVTVVSKFKASLDKLMSTLTCTNVHYIRCVRPNSIGSPNMFDRNQIMNQLRACGVIETIKICASGYPVRLTHREFIKRYNFVVIHGRPYPQDTPNAQSPSPWVNEVPSLHASVNKLKKEDRRARRRKRSGYDHTPSICRSILASIGITMDEDKENLTGGDAFPGVKLGRTKIFLREEVVEKLERFRIRTQSRCAFTIQCCWRRYKQCIVNKERQAAVTIQKVLRGWLIRSRYLAIRNANVILQRHFRLCIEKKRCEKIAAQKSAGESQKETVNAVKLPCHVPLQISTYTRPHPSWFSPFVPRSYGLLLNKTEFNDHKMDVRIARGDGIASIRRIEQTPIIFHVRKTPLTNAEKRPLDGRSIDNEGLAAIISLAK